jgi:hypothetical protein
VARLSNCNALGEIQQNGSDYIKRFKLFAIFFAVLFITLPMASASTLNAYGMNTCNKGWYHTGGTFENYCPNCHHHGTLAKRIKRSDEITCTNCDSDFCFCGKEKMNSGAAYLTRVTPKVEKPVEKPVVEEKPVDPLQQKRDLLLNFVSNEMPNGTHTLVFTGPNGFN